MCPDDGVIPRTYWAALRVPSMVADLIDRAAAGDGIDIDTLLFGGAPAPQVLPDKAKKTFRTTVL